MNELVKKLSKNEYDVIVNRPDQSAKALQERIHLNHVHVLFEKTGTEVGMRLEPDKCDYRTGDFAKGTGNIYLQGVLTLNGDKVRCMVNVNLDSMKGTGRLELVDEDVYKSVLALN